MFLTTVISRQPYFEKTFIVESFYQKFSFIQFGSLVAASPLVPSLAKERESNVVYYEG